MTQLVLQNSNISSHVSEGTTAVLRQYEWLKYIFVALQNKFWNSVSCSAILIYTCNSHRNLEKTAWGLHEAHVRSVNRKDLVLFLETWIHKQRKYEEQNLFKSVRLHVGCLWLVRRNFCIIILLFLVKLFYLHSKLCKK